MMLVAAQSFSSGPSACCGVSSTRRSSAMSTISNNKHQPRRGGSAHATTRHHVPIDPRTLTDHRPGVRRRGGEAASCDDQQKLFLDDAQTATF